MKRLYYLTENINVAEQLSDRLHEEGISDWNFHVLAKDKAELVRHHLNTTTPIQELDVIRSGERGVIVGFVAGIIVTSYLVLVAPIGEYMNWIAQIASVVLFSMFGAWIGGLVGVSTENYQIRRFHKYIENGSYLLLIDVSRDQQARTESIVNQFSGKIGRAHV